MNSFQDERVGYFHCLLKAFQEKRVTGSYYLKMISYVFLKITLVPK